MKNLNKISIPISIIIAGLIMAAVLVYINQGKVKEPTTETLSAKLVAEKAINFINQNLLQEGLTASLINTGEENGFYKIHFKIGEREFDSYATKDGKLFFPEIIDLEEAPIAQAPEASQPSSESTISPEELTEFIDCLEEANFVVYGANWCGWTKKLVEMLGGFDMVKSIYIECTEEKELCEEKEVSAYPTILIAGEEYQGARTFEEIATATGCEVPSGAESISGESSGGGGCQ